jgi:uncharacterized protein (DUF1810 family)
MASADDPHDLARFVQVQEGTYARALAELRGGRKRSHWIWYILPQLRSLGSSAMALRFGIESLDEARAYLQHPVLGARLVECVATINAHRSGGTGPSAQDMLGDIDARKFLSCLTLFMAAAEDDKMTRQVFREAVDKFYGGALDQRTLALLNG